MQFQYRQICELPFMLNVKSGDYEVAFGERVVSLNIDNELYAASKQGSTTPAVAMIARESEVRNFTENNSSYALIKLRTVITRNDYHHSPFIPLVNDDDVLDCLQSEQISKTPSADNSREKAQIVLACLTPLQKHQWVIKASTEKFTRKLFPPERGYEFLTEINTVVQKYCTEFNDHFAQEVSLHNVCQTTCGGIVQIVYSNGQLLSNATLVGKIPPIFRKSWFNHEEQFGRSFKDVLKERTPVDQVKMLLVRSRSLLEKGAFRSSIIESSAALEAEVSNVIRRSLAKSGWEHSDIDDLLKRNQKFDDKAKKLLKLSVGFTLAEVDNTLWSKSKHYREQLRHKIAHSEVEPTLKDAEAAVNVFEKIIMKFREKLNSKP